MRKLIVLALFAAAIGALVASPAGAKRPGVNGKIVFNADNNVTGQEQVYTIDPDGTDLRLLANDAEAGQWSPDGTRVSLGTQIVNVDTGTFTDLPSYEGLFLPCIVWSPDGTRLACEGFGTDDPALTGIYTMLSSASGGLQRLTSSTDDDCPSDYSPNGNRLVFSRLNFTEGTSTLYVMKLDSTERGDGRGDRGGDLTALMPSGTEVNFCTGSWSPQGNEIVFSARIPSGTRSTIWVVHSDGSGLRQVPIAGCGGTVDDPASSGCNSPVWSPDGTKILFERFTPGTRQADLYTVNADGSGLFRVTNTPDLSEGTGDWGTHPVTP
jgi:Tol biopolymer transport system component